MTNVFPRIIILKILEILRKLAITKSIVLFSGSRIKFYHELTFFKGFQNFQTAVSGLRKCVL